MEISYGGSGTVLSQMMLARTGDLYIPGSQDFMDTAESKGAVDPATRKIIAYLCRHRRPKGNPKNIRPWRTCASRSAAGNRQPRQRVLGLYAVEIFDRAGVTAKVKPNIVVQTKSCDDTATVLALGQVDAVIGWDVFDDWQPDKITVVPLPAEQVVKTANIPVALSVYVKDKALAQDFITYITGPEGKRVFAKHGYLVEDRSGSLNQPAARSAGRTGGRRNHLRGTA